MHSKGLRPLVLFSLLFLMTAGTGPMLADAAALAGAPGDLALGIDVASEDFRERTVRSAYANLAEYAELTAPDLRFELNDFQTFTPDQFDEVRWLDLVDMPEGWVLTMHRDRRTNDQTGESRVGYEPRWEEVEPLWRRTSRGPELLTLRTDEYLRAVSAEQKHLAEVQAITAYTVQVEHDGRERLYKAAFLWVPADEGADAAFVVSDHVTQGLEEAARDPELPMRDLGFLAIADLAPSPNKATCSSWSSTLTLPTSRTSTSGHVVGQHSSQATFKIRCECQSNCRSICSAWLHSGSCTDSGFTTSSCHKMASNSDSLTSVQDNGNTTGASCSVGYGCAQKACLFCACGLSVSVKAEPWGVSFGAAGANWTGHNQFQRTCAKCS